MVWPEEKLSIEVWLFYQVVVSYGDLKQKVYQIRNKLGNAYMSYGSSEFLYLHESKQFLPKTRVDILKTTASLSLAL